MKGIAISLFLLMVSIRVFSIEQSVYIVLPEGISIESEEEIGNNISSQVMVSGGGVESIEGKKVESFDPEDSGVEGYQVMKLKVEHTGEKGKMKLALGYKDTEKNRYVLLVDSRVDSEVVDLMKDYYEEGKSPAELITPSMHSSYEKFPGLEISEDRRVIMTVIGDKEIEDTSRTDPSNIVARFQPKEDDDGDEMSGEDININPANSDKNTFMIEGADGEVMAMSDLKNIRKEGKRYIFYDEGANHLRFRVKRKDAEIEINGSKVVLEKNEIYNFSNLESVVIKNKKSGGNGNWYVSFSGKDVKMEGNDEDSGEYGEGTIPTGQEEVKPESIESDQFYIKDGNGEYWIAEEENMDKSSAKLTRINVKKSKEEDKGGDDTYTIIEEYSIAETKEYIEQDGKYYFYYGPAKEVFFKMDSGKKYPNVEGYITIENEVLYKYKPSILNKWLLLRGEKDGSKFEDDKDKWYISLVDPPSEEEAEEVIVVGSVGDVVEGSVNLTSGSEKSIRKRRSELKIRLITEDGGTTGDSNLEIQSIEN